jgi:hypothetical protein
MGMDVSGLAPTTEAGKYFRNNCWWWRPLWYYCEQVAPDLAEKVEYAQSNDGDGLKTQAECDRLADALEQAVAARVEWTHDPTGLKAKADREGPMYPFDYDNVREWIVFLRGCGGFAIW